MRVPRPVALLAGGALVALVGALAGRLRPVQPLDRAALVASLVSRGRAAIDRDARTLRAVAEALRRSTELSEIVEGGGAAVGPGQLFDILSQALPAGEGWGAVLFDRTGRAVAWGGEAGDLERERTANAPGFGVSFHVTRFTLAYRLPWFTGAERRGVLAVSRRYPTGLLRPDLVEFLGLGGGPLRARLRARASTAPGRLIALGVEWPRGANGDLSRRRATPWALLLGALLVALGGQTPMPALGVVAARLALLLGTPRGETGAWDTLVAGQYPLLGLVSTPADVFLTGLAGLVVLRAALLGPPPGARSGAGRVLLGLAGLALAVGPFLLGREAGLFRPDLVDDLSLVPPSLGSYLFRAGGVAFGVALLGLGAALLARPGPPVPRGAPARLTGALGVFASLAALGLAGSAVAPVLGASGAMLLALALAERAAYAHEGDLLGRAATAVFLCAAAAVSGAAGLADGDVRRLDAALLHVEASDVGDGGEAQQREVREWMARLGTLSTADWLPAGGETLVADLARALWVRGADREFPGAGDVLTLRDRSGVASSFGVTRPGVEAQERLVRADTGLPGFEATFAHVAFPPRRARDPLLSAVVDAALPGRVAVERIEYDAAGRSRGRGGQDRTELPAALLASARQRGFAVGPVAVAEGVARMRVRPVSPGFVGYVAAYRGASAMLGSGVAAAEVALPAILFLLAVPARRPSRGLDSALLQIGTFRTRLVALVLLFGAVPLALSLAAVRVTLERHSSGETSRRSLALLAEARRALPPGSAPGPSELSEVAAVLGTDLLLYRDGRLVAASRALPVAAEVAAERLNARVAAVLADGRREAAAVAARGRPGVPRFVEAAEALSPDEALAVAVAEDEAARTPVDGLVLFTVGVALLAFGLGSRAALSLGRPVAQLITSAERIGSGVPAPRLERPAAADLARLVDAFETMAGRVRERTESLAREREAAVGLLSNLTAGVLVFRPADGSVLLANPAADALLPGGDLPSRVAPLAWTPLREALGQGRLRSGPYETRITVGEGGSERVFRVVIAALPVDEGVDRSLLLLEDLTDFVRADRLGAWVEAARAIAHDVKNPLTPIRLAAERLLRLQARGETPSAEVITSTATNVLRQVEVLSERTGRLSRFSGLQALDRIPLDREAVGALLDEVAAGFRGKERLTVEVSVEPDLPMVELDRPLVRDALTNFVLNAVEAIGDRGGAIRLSAEPEPLSDGRPGVRFRCEDDGPGVPAEALSRLFEPAFSTKSRGSGMGLAATRRAVERHSGRVFARPRPDGGLSIGFVLPALG